MFHIHNAFLNVEDVYFVSVSIQGVSTYITFELNHQKYMSCQPWTFWQHENKVHTKIIILWVKKSNAKWYNPANIHHESWWKEYRSNLDTLLSFYFVKLIFGWFWQHFLYFFSFLKFIGHIDHPGCLFVWKVVTMNPKSPLFSKTFQS